jgi:hypothetical protein
MASSIENERLKKSRGLNRENLQETDLQKCQMLDGISGFFGHQPRERKRNETKLHGGRVKCLPT